MDNDTLAEGERDAATTAVAVFELVLMLWVFTAVLTIFQLIVLLRERAQSVFLTQPAVIVLRGTVLFPGLRHSV